MPQTFVVRERRGGSDLPALASALLMRGYRPVYSRKRALRPGEFLLTPTTLTCNQRAEDLEEDHAEAD